MEENRPCRRDSRGVPRGGWAPVVAPARCGGSSRLLEAFRGSGHIVETQHDLARSTCDLIERLTHRCRLVLAQRRRLRRRRLRSVRQGSASPVSWNATGARPISGLRRLQPGPGEYPGERCGRLPLEWLAAGGATLIGYQEGSMPFVRKFYIADTHFGHRSIIDNCNRPFADVAQMDAAMVERWNETVCKDDLVYHLGDFGRPGKDPMSFRRLFHALNGRKVLIIGNHDLRSDGRLDPEIARLPWDRPPTNLLEVHDEGRRVLLCHYALRVWSASHHGSTHFYGHSHGRLPGHGLSRDVGVDMPDVDFRPRTFVELTCGWGFSACQETGGQTDEPGPAQPPGFAP